MLDEAARLGGQVGKLYGEGKYDAAVPLAQRALILQEKALGRDHPAVASFVNNVAELYRVKRGA